VKKYLRSSQHRCCGLEY